MIQIRRRQQKSPRKGGFVVIHVAQRRLGMYHCNCLDHGISLTHQTNSVQEPQNTAICVAADDSWQEKTMRVTGFDFSPSEPNSTQKRAVINDYGDKQHFLAWSLVTGFLVLKISQNLNRLAKTKAFKNKAKASILRKYFHAKQVLKNKATSLKTCGIAMDKINLTCG